MKKILKLIITLCAAVFIAAVGIYSIMVRLYPCDYSEYVERYSDEYGVEKSLIYAVIKCESGFDPNAVSNVGAKGLMQITPETFNWVQTKLDGSVSLDENELYVPETNIKYGVYLLKLHLNEFGDPAVAVAAYHAGRGKVNSWLSDPEVSHDGKSIKEIPFNDTRTYVKRVMRTIDIYKKLYQMKG